MIELNTLKKLTKNDMTKMGLPNMGLFDEILLKIFSSQIGNNQFKKLRMPEYSELKCGDWKITRKDVDLLPGYFTNFSPAKPNYVLSKNNRIWMSLTPMELESLSPHALNAFGHTVIMGLGMGLLLYNIAAKESVDKITVIEKDKNIISLYYHLFSENKFEGFEKIKIINADALKWQPENGETIDFLSCDI